MPKETFNNLSDTKKNRVVEAILKECMEKVYESVSINQIIKNADISRGSFYQYFEDKLDMYIWLMDGIFSRQNEFIRSHVLEDYPSVFKEIIHVYQLGIEYSMKNQKDAVLQSQFSRSNDDHMKQKVYESGNDVLKTFISAIVEKGQSTQEITRNFPNEVITSYIIALGRDTFMMFIKDQDRTIYDYFETVLTNAFKGGSYEKIT